MGMEMGTILTWKGKKCKVKGDEWTWKLLEPNTALGEEQGELVPAKRVEFCLDGGRVR